MTYEICGDCLHHRHAHAEIFLNGTKYMLCAICNTTCDYECYLQLHKASNTTVTIKGVVTKE